MRPSCLFILFLSYGLLISCQNSKTREGDQYFQNGDYAGAVDLYTRYLKLHPNHVKTLFNRARAYQELGKDAEAVRDFEHVTRIDPENDMAYLGLGVHYMNLKNYDKAGVYFQNAIDANHHNAKAYYLKGRVSHQRGLFSDALKNYNRALVIDDQLGEAYLYRGLVRIQLKTGHDPCLDFRKAQSLEVKDAMDAMARYCR